MLFYVFFPREKKKRERNEAWESYKSFELILTGYPKQATNSKLFLNLCQAEIRKYPPSNTEIPSLNTEIPSLKY